jgi:hypothetical protein
LQESVETIATQGRQHREIMVAGKERAGATRLKPFEEVQHCGTVLAAVDVVADEHEVLGKRINLVDETMQQRYFAMYVTEDAKSVHYRSTFGRCV